MGDSSRELGRGPLQAGMPGRARAAAEIAFVLAIVFTGELPWPWISAAALLVAGLAIVAPWRAGPSLVVRVATTLALAVTIVMPVALAEATHGAMSDARRIGIEIAAVDARPDDPVAAGGVLEVTTITPGATADGILAPGDRITAVDGVPLARTSPSRDLVARLQKSGDTVALDVVRDHRLETRTVPVPRPRHGPAAWRALGAFARDNVLGGSVVRALCVIALVLLLLRSDGQTPAALGLTTRGAPLDALWGLTLTLGAFATMLVSGVLVQGAMRAFGSNLVQQDAADRPRLLLDIFGGTSMPVFAAAIAVTATFEEVVFRGLLLPRLQRLTGSWGVAIALGAIAFGAGHVYEGWSAVAQTTALGVFFGVVFLQRGRLLPVIVAHTVFDVSVYGLLVWLESSGMLEKMRHTMEQQNP
jgi:uncharacterized protein